MSESKCEVSQLVHWYREYLDHGKSAAFVSCIATRYSIATLVRLTQSADLESRRAAVLALGMLGDRSAISAIGAAMKDDDRCVRLVAEVAFGDLCRREFGESSRQQLDIVRRHIDGGRFERARELLAAVVEVWPEFSEAWFLKATNEFYREQFVQTIADARRATASNPCHFAAYLMEAKAWLELGSAKRALTAFRRSFAINPSQTTVQEYIEVLTRQVGSQ